MKYESTGENGMRLRGRKGILEEIEAQPELIVLNPADYRGKWAQRFGNDKPIHVELGMGKGKFIGDLSMRNPDINYIGIDMYDELVRRAAEKARRFREGAEGATLANLQLVRFNIEQIEQVFADGEIERIYLNFSDPWPKTKHIGRRLSHAGFVTKYIKMLNAEGTIHMKTDSKLLFEFSLNSFADLGLRLRNISLDLHAAGIREDLVLTEYETKFIERGMPIYRCEVVIGANALQRAVVKP